MKGWASYSRGYWGTVPGFTTPQNESIDVITTRHRGPCINGFHSVGGLWSGVIPFIGRIPGLGIYEVDAVCSLETDVEAGWTRCASATGVRSKASGIRKVCSGVSTGDLKTPRARLVRCRAPTECWGSPRDRYPTRGPSWYSP